MVISKRTTQFMTDMGTIEDPTIFIKALNPINSKSYLPVVFFSLLGPCIDHFDRTPGRLQDPLLTMYSAHLNAITFDLGVSGEHLPVMEALIQKAYSET